MQTEIAHAGVQRLAETDKDAALQALDKYTSYLPDDQQAALRQYADVQEGLRGQDAAAQQQQQARDASVQGYHSATRYLHALADPDTGQFRAPQGFLTSLVADPAISPPTKLALRAGFHVLHQRGDPAQSDPHVVADMIGRMAGDVQPLRPGAVGSVPGVTGDVLDRMHDQGLTGYSTPGGLTVTRGGTTGAPGNDNVQQGEIMAHLGSGLTVADAAFLNHLIGPSNPQRRADIQHLAEVVQQARGTIAHPMNGPAGDIAFGRFTNWLLPALARGAHLNELTANNAIQRFAPTVEDYRKAIRRG